MKLHDRLRIVFTEARQNWRAFAYVMQVHENHYIKRAGVAGIRARASSHLSAFPYVMIKILGNIYSLHLQSRSESCH
ncbi:hypothetical protein DNW15_16660 [Salmonella enterica subsp. enterica]|nr:hypothetical protein AW51_05685 [Salmonella enterica subsp. enterica serovar Anatum str. USDA-ARS-USMARC-1736]EAZ5606771.1 hypothetical protein [Salmonella enterica]EBS1981556.1 hypothetical protein [Salmonella enterica subsp. enterica serovar Agama]EBU6434400.1 hypothetical protein [Salmonella enterica subsp. enterica serovar Muenster]ECC8915056.1 hypothetical protein [Salmonella enterica subsp. enterica serovar Telhashomer]ECD3624937.1 hypothetical protein [Salmonella enterica subsp. ente